MSWTVIAAVAIVMSGFYAYCTTLIIPVVVMLFYIWILTVAQTRKRKETQSEDGNETDRDLLTDDQHAIV